METKGLDEARKKIKPFQFPKHFNAFEKLQSGQNLNEDVGGQKMKMAENSEDPSVFSSFSETSKRAPSSFEFEVKDLDQLFFLAEESFKKDRFQEALKFLNPLVLKDYKKPEAYHMLGTIYYDQGKFNKAIRMFRKALEIEPGFTDSSIGLSILLNDLGRYDEGKSVFEKAKALIQETDAEKESKATNTKLSEKHNELGHLYFHYRRYDEALAQYFKALSLNSLNLEIHLSIVSCYLSLKKYDDAILELKDLCKEEPDFHKARILLGKIYYDQNEFSEALSEWNEVLRKDPKNIQVQLLLSKAKDKHLKFQS